MTSPPPPSKQLIVVAGPNGAGKTTFALKYAAEYGLPYLGADAIAYELAPDDLTGARVAAGREFLRRVAEGLREEESLVVESTLAGRSMQRILNAARSSGFQVRIAYLFLDSVATCQFRVQERVKKGGHNVPPDDIRRRFYRSAANFWAVYRPLADHWSLMYNSENQAEEVAIGNQGRTIVRDVERFSQFQAILSSG